MEHRNVRVLFLAETILIGAAAFLCGTAPGTVLCGILKGIVMRTFEIPYSFHVSFSARAFLYSLAFFLLLYSAGRPCAASSIKKKTIADLLYDDRKNEEIKECRAAALGARFPVSLLSLAAGALCFSRAAGDQTNAALLYWGGALLILAGICLLSRLAARAG